MTTDYTPIDCAAHSVLELLALRRRRVRVHFADGSGCGVVEGRAVDIRSQRGVEFLLIDTGETQHRLRLDRLQAIYDGARQVFSSQDSDSGRYEL